MRWCIITRVMVERTYIIEAESAEDARALIDERDPRNALDVPGSETIVSHGLVPSLE